MPQILIVTGSPGAGVSLAASALALGMTSHGESTLLLGLGSAAGMSALLGAELGPQPTRAVAGLDVLVPDPASDLAEMWERSRAQLPEGVAGMAADELPLPAGSGALAGLLRLAELRSRYQRIVVDAGPHDALLLALGLPDSARWMIRLLLGLDRGAGQSRASVLGALLPSGLLPTGVVQGAQEMRVMLERVRGELIAPSVASACYVLRPDAAALAEARLAIPAIQLHGLAVASLAIGPLSLPGAQPNVHEQPIVEQAAGIWPRRPTAQLAHSEGGGLGAIAAIAPSLAACDPATPPSATLRDQHQGAPAVVVELPGMPKQGLGLTMSGDELIVRIGPYRRHILLPEGLRGATAIRATREGDLLIVRRRT